MKLTKKIVLVGLLPIIMLLAGSLISGYYLKSSNDVTANYIKTNAAKQLLLYDIYRNLGYIGGIHEFKNYVLRFDEFYEKASRSHMTTARSLISEYLNYQDNTDIETQALNTLDRTIADYISKIDEAKNAMKLSGATPRSVDKVVKVDDGPAREALAKLHQFFINERLNKLEQLKEANQMALNFSVISFTLAILLSLYLSRLKSLEILNSLKRLATISRKIAVGEFKVQESTLKEMPDDEIKEVASQLKDMGHKLEYSFSNLLDFAHVAAHDLQAPAKKVHSYTDLLEMECESHLNDNARKYIQEIRTSSEWMVELIRRLLKFSNINFINTQLDKLDLNQLLVEVQNLLKVEIETSGVELQIKEMPSVMGNNELIKNLFINVISNSLKFQKENHSGVICISAEQVENNMWKIQIQDDGIGFNMDKIETVMRPFGRIHSKDQYSGFGIGLATCKKITEALNGEFDIHSKEDEGTVVSITLRSA